MRIAGLNNHPTNKTNIGRPIHITNLHWNRFGMLIRFLLCRCVQCRSINKYQKLWLCKKTFGHKIIQMFLLLLRGAIVRGLDEKVLRVLSHTLTRKREHSSSIHPGIEDWNSFRIGHSITQLSLSIFASYYSSCGLLPFKCFTYSDLH